MQNNYRILFVWQSDTYVSGQRGKQTAFQENAAEH